MQQNSFGGNPQQNPYSGYAQQDPYSSFSPQNAFPQQNPSFQQGGYTGYPQQNPYGEYPQQGSYGGYPQQNPYSEYPQQNSFGGYSPQNTGGARQPFANGPGGYQPFSGGYGQDYLQQPSEFDAAMQEMPDMPTAQTEEAPMKIRKKKKKAKPPRRSGNGARNWILTIIGIAVLAGGGWLGIQALGLNQKGSAVVQSAVMGENYSGTALIVRNEVAFDEEGVQTIDYVAAEGSNVRRGDVVCYVYSTGYSSKESTTLQNYRDQIKSYQQSLLAAETSFDQKMTRLETSVVERGLEVRSLVQGARGNLLSQETLLSDAIDERQAYFRSKYSSDMRMDRLFDDETTQQQRIDSWIKQKIATSESIVSFYTDGFESALTPDNFQDYSPAEVRSMANGNKPSADSTLRGRTTLFRLIQPGNYAVLLLVDNTSWNPEEGKIYRLMLEQFYDKTVEARVLSFTRSGGELLLRLAVMGDASDVLYIRSCTARLGEYVDCLQVPENALYTQSEQLGVVVLSDSAALFVPVTLLGRQNGTAYIAAVTPGTLSQGQTVKLFH